MHILVCRQKKDYSMTKSLNLGHSVDPNSLADMSKSLAGFHLTVAGGAGSKAMHESTMDQVKQAIRIYNVQITNVQITNISK